jgi:hypothetical protein
MATPPAQIKQPTLYELSGDGLQITYMTTSLTGDPQFYYHDASESKVFTGDQIRTTVEPELGTLVSVVIRLTVDAGSTTFTLLVPRVSLRLSDSVPITTVGITTLHKFSIIGPPHGQSDFYTPHRLQGTAAFVVF